MLNVIVTGGSRGLGLATAKLLGESGYRVIAAARSEGNQLPAAMEEIEAKKTGALCFAPIDLSNIDDIPDFVTAIRREYGEIYGLVNNAGLGTHGVLANMYNSQIKELVQLNTLAPIILSKFVVRSMLTSGNGRIVNIASIVSSTGFSGLSVYAATKAAMIGFTRSLAREVGRLGITVNAIAPGFIETEMTQSLSEADKKRVANRSALHRLAEPKDVAEAIKFLMGESGRNITGTVLTVDAGSTA
ncbi:MAG: SDR family NAD(P)-dependent oxidoreductase [Rhodomicrobium sp.]